MNPVKEVRLGALVQYTPVEPCDYGPVLIMAGPHKGKIAYYDDDEDTKAIVYFGVIGEEDVESCLIKFENMAKLPENLFTFVTTYVPSPSSGVMLSMTKKEAE